MKMMVRDFVEKVGPEKDPNIPGWLKVHKGQYERFHTPMSWPDMGGWESEVAFVKKRAKHDRKYKGKQTVEVGGEKFTGHHFDGGTTYGIHSFILISFE